MSAYWSWRYSTVTFGYDSLNRAMSGASTVCSLPPQTTRVPSTSEGCPADASWAATAPGTRRSVVATTANHLADLRGAIPQTSSFAWRAQGETARPLADSRHAEKPMSIC